MKPRVPRTRRQVGKAIAHIIGTDIVKGGQTMMPFDMTAQLAPIFYGMVALLAVSSVAIAADAFGPSVANLISHYMRRNKPRLSTRGTIVPTSA
jgi:hypothetical protein